MSNRDFRALERSMRERASGGSSLLLFIIISLFCAAGYWAYVTEIDDVTRADGRIVPSGDLQVIEAAEDGILKALLAQEGEIVDEGQLLMELDGIFLTSQLDQEMQRAYGLMARIARLDAEIKGGALEYDETLVGYAPDVVKSEAALYLGRLEELQSQIAILETQRSQREQELREELVTLDTASITMAVLKEERAMMEPLVERGIEPQTTLLRLRRNEAEWQGKQTRAEAALEALRAVYEGDTA